MMIVVTSRQLQSIGAWSAVLCSKPRCCTNHLPEFMMIIILIIVMFMMIVMFIMIMIIKMMMMIPPEPSEHTQC